MSDAWHRCNTCLLCVACSRLGHRTPFFLSCTEIPLSSNCLGTQITEAKRLEASAQSACVLSVICAQRRETEGSNREAEIIKLLSVAAVPR
jgi:hypothetical protein